MLPTSTGAPLERRRRQKVRVFRLEPGRCFFCGCTDRRACPGGCSWVNDQHTVCSLCEPRLAVGLGEIAAFYIRQATTDGSRVPSKVGQWIIELLLEGGPAR